MASIISKVVLTYLALLCACSFVYSVVSNPIDLNNIGVDLVITASKIEPQQFNKTVEDQKNLNKTIDDPKNLNKTVEDQKNLNKTVDDQKTMTKIVNDPKNMTKIVDDPKNMTKTVNESKNLTKAVDESKNLAKDVQRDENLKFELSPRLLVQPRADATSARTIITYKLGKRVNGK